MKLFSIINRYRYFRFTKFSLVIIGSIQFSDRCRLRIEHIPSQIIFFFFVFSYIKLLLARSFSGMFLFFQPITNWSCNISSKLCLKLHWMYNFCCSVQSDIDSPRGAENVRTRERGAGEILTDRGNFDQQWKKKALKEKNGNFLLLGEIFISTKINK